MYNRNIKPGSTPQNGTPFVCQITPFVCIDNTVIDPFVCIKLPFVCNKGFSLVELIITLTIAGILMAIAVPGIQNFVSSNRLTSQVNELMANISISRSEAIKRAVTTGVCVTASGGSSCVTSGNWANGWLVYYVCPTGDPSGCTAGNNVALKIHEALGGSNTLTAPADAIVFSKSGLLSSPSSGTRQFTLTDTKNSASRIVCLAATGRPAMSAVTCP